jgi:MerR family transcriptional regulator, mercuric resistance operon regulatory protein
MRPPNGDKRGRWRTVSPVNRRYLRPESAERRSHGSCRDGWLDFVPRYRVHAGEVRTSELAARAAVNPQTLRYYERRGLLAGPTRSSGGYRMYPADAVHRVRFIRRAQELGFTLAEVDVLLHLAAGGPDGCEKTRALATEKVADLRRRIADLQALQAGLARLAATCELPQAQRECPILHELGHGPHDSGSEQEEPQ